MASFGRGNLSQLIFTCCNGWRGRGSINIDIYLQSHYDKTLKTLLLLFLFFFSSYREFIVMGTYRHSCVTTWRLTAGYTT